MIKLILIEITSFLLAIALALFFIICILCCLPYHLINYICKEYKEDKETYRMHRSVEEFLDKQRVGADHAV